MRTTSRAVVQSSRFCRPTSRRICAAARLSAGELGANMLGMFSDGTGHHATALFALALFVGLVVAMVRRRVHWSRQHANEQDVQTARRALPAAIVSVAAAAFALACVVALGVEVTSRLAR